MSTLAWWIVLVPALLAAAIDLRSRRIPNVIVGPALLVVLALSLWQGVAVAAVIGMIVAGLVGVALRIAARGGFGAGDVKLLAYSGAAVGIGGVGSLLLGTALGGGALGVAYLVRSGRGAAVPYGVAITLGLALALATSPTRG